MIYLYNLTDIFERGIVFSVMLCHIITISIVWYIRFSHSYLSISIILFSILCYSVHISYYIVELILLVTHLKYTHRTYIHILAHHIIKLHSCKELLGEIHQP